MYMEAKEISFRKREETTTVYNCSTDIKVSKDVGPVS